MTNVIILALGPPSFAQALSLPQQIAPPSNGISARGWFYFALLDLFLAACIGVVLRGIYIWEMPFVHFRPWLHGHSHTALLGWLFLGTCVVLLHDGGYGLIGRTSRILFTGLQAAVLVMFISFPIQGYGAVSITASTLHMLLAYFLLAKLWRGSSHWPIRGSRILTRTAIVMFLLSTLGIWSIGPIIALGYQGHEIYYWSVQFFLHFQFNGWFWFAAMAIGVRWAERQGIDLRLDRFTLWLWVISAIFTYALAIAWSEPLPVVFATISISVILQVWAALRTLNILRTLRSEAYERFTFWPRVLVGIALLAMAIKVLTQAAVAIPTVAIVGFTIRHFVIGFIHLNTLAMMTTLLLAYAGMHRWLHFQNGAVRIGIILLLAGIVGSEFLLFLQGTFFWAGLGSIAGHYWHLFIASLLMPLGIAVLLWKGWRDRRSTTAMDHDVPT